MLVGTWRRDRCRGARGHGADYDRRVGPWIYLTLPDLRAGAALLAATAAFWGTYRQLLRLLA